MLESAKRFRARNPEGRFAAGCEMSVVEIQNDLSCAAGVARTGHPAGRQGPLRHRRARDDVRLGRLRRPRARADRRGGAAARGGRLRERRQDEPARVRLRHDVGEPALRRRPQPALPRPDRRGSSGGSAAALAAGLADAALGTDSAGSIRIPAACCGVVGHKPTHGLVSLEGCWPLAASFDTAGPLAVDVDGVRADARARSRPAYEPVELESLEELEVGVAWTELGRSARPGPRRGGGRPLPAPPRDRAAADRQRDATPSSCARSRTSTGSSSPRTATPTARTSGSRSSAASR